MATGTPVLPAAQTTGAATNPPVATTAPTFDRWIISRHVRTSCTQAAANVGHVHGRVSRIGLALRHVCDSSCLSNAFLSTGRFDTRKCAVQAQSSSCRHCQTAIEGKIWPSVPPPANRMVREEEVKGLEGYRSRVGDSIGWTYADCNHCFGHWVNVHETFLFLSPVSFAQCNDQA